MSPGGPASPTCVCRGGIVPFGIVAPPFAFARALPLPGGIVTEARVDDTGGGAVTFGGTVAFTFARATTACGLAVAPVDGTAVAEIAFTPAAVSPACDSPA